MRKVFLVWLIIQFFIPGLQGAGSNGQMRMHWNRSRGYEPFKYATPDGIRLQNQTDTLQYDFFKLSQPAEEVSLSFRSRNINGNPLRKYPYTSSDGKHQTISNPHWGFLLTTLSDTIVITIEGVESLKGIESEPALKITLNDFARKEKLQTIIDKGIHPHTGDNIWNIVWDKNAFSLRGGNVGLKDINRSDLPGYDITGIGFICGWGGDIIIEDIDLVMPESPQSRQSFKNLSEIEKYLQHSQDATEGYWSVFDRDLEESLLKLGGDYRFACIQDGNSYLLLYLTGAQINKRGWKEGDVKAILSPTPFQGIYDIKWYDSQKDIMNHEIKAQLSDNGLLEIQFPYQSSKIRLRKENSPSSGGTSATSGTTSEPSSKSAAKSSSSTGTQN